MTPNQSEIVIIGGGAIGCGIAYSLCRAGKTDIVLIERANEVGQVTTLQGAGLCGQVRTTAERTKLAMHSTRTFEDLQKNSEVKPDWHPVGSIRIALSEKAADRFQELYTIARECDLEAELIDNLQTEKLWPAMEFSEVKSVLWCPSDGYMTPQSVAKCYRHECERMGAVFNISTSVEGIVVENDRVEAVATDRGTIQCETLINAAGAHAYHIAGLAGLNFPIVAVRHEYFVTVGMDSLNPNLPCFRIPDLSLYGRAEDSGLLLGGWENDSFDILPAEYGLRDPAPAIDPDWDVLNDFENRFTRIFPGAKRQKKNRVAKGWPTFTPDGRFIIGESSRLKGFVMAGGCNAHGISGSAGIGKLLVESLYENEPSEYVRSLSPDRFTETEWDWESARAEARRVYETYYSVESC